MIYLDNTATTKSDNLVINEINYYLHNYWKNPSSVYADKESKCIDKAKSTIKHYFNVPINTTDIIFTSGASESNTLALQGFCQRSIIDNVIPIIITTGFEHKSISLCVDTLNKLFPQLIVHHLTTINYTVTSYELKQLLKKYQNIRYRILVSIQFVNNEIGVIQNINQFSNIVANYQNAYFHTDVTQGINLWNNYPVSMKNIDMLSCSGHKIGTPKGIGFLYKRNDVPLISCIYGTQMNGLRGGTENLPYIMGIKKTFELLQEKKKKNEIKSEFNYILSLSEKFKDKFKKLNCTVIANTVKTSPYICSVVLPEGISGESMLHWLSTSDIYISTGSACNSHLDVPSQVLLNFDFTEDEARRVIRLSLSSKITESSCNKFFIEFEKGLKLLNDF